MRALEKQEIIKDNEGKTMDQLIEEHIQDKVPLDITQSLFCNHKSNSLEENIEYMKKRYRFTIPFEEFCTNREGLIRYLGEKVGVGNYTLYDNRQFDSVEACQHHMVDTSTCMILWEGNEEEYSDFYDYQTLRERELAMSKLRVADNGYELIVNDKKVLGHRDLAVYYNQNVRVRDPVQNLALQTNRLERIDYQKKINMDRKTHKRMQNERIRIQMQTNNQGFYRPDNPL
jgi:pre-60S factor REI1